MRGSELSSSAYLLNDAYHGLFRNWPGGDLDGGIGGHATSIELPGKLIIVDPSDVTVATSDTTVSNRKNHIYESSKPGLYSKPKIAKQPSSSS